MSRQVSELPISVWAKIIEKCDQEGLSALRLCNRTLAAEIDHFCPDYTRGRGVLRESDLEKWLQWARAGTRREDSRPMKPAWRQVHLGRQGHAGWLEWGRSWWWGRAPSSPPHLRPVQSWRQTTPLLEESEFWRQRYPGCVPARLWLGPNQASPYGAWEDASRRSVMGIVKDPNTDFLAAVVDCPMAIAGWRNQRMVAIYHVRRKVSCTSAGYTVRLDARPTASFLAGHDPIDALRLAVFRDHMDVSVRSPPEERATQVLPLCCTGRERPTTKVYQMSLDNDLRFSSDHRLWQQTYSTHPLLDTSLVYG